MLTPVELQPQQKIATATKDGTVYLWDSQGNELNRFPAYPCLLNDQLRSCIDRINFSADGSRVAIAGTPDGQGRSIRVWHLADNIYEEFLIGIPGTLAGISFAPNNELLVATNTGSCLKVSKGSDGQLQDLACGDIVSSLIEARFSPDGQRAMVFYGEESENAKLWNFLEGSKPESISNQGNDQDNNQGRISRGSSFSLDGQQLAATGVDGTVNLLLLSGNGCCYLATAVGLRSNCLRAE